MTFSPTWTISLHTSILQEHECHLRISSKAEQITVVADMFDTFTYRVAETNESVQKYLLILRLFCYFTFFLSLMNVMTHKRHIFFIIWLYTSKSHKKNVTSTFPTFIHIYTHTHTVYCTQNSPHHRKSDLTRLSSTWSKVRSHLYGNTPGTTQKHTVIVIFFQRP